MYVKNFCILVVIAIAAVSCGKRHDFQIDSAYQLLDTNPDSALTILDDVNHGKLSNNLRAKYALVYTIAQDKSGLDVDNDSLLSVAYDYFCDREKDSLYAKCMYYMGKYYALNKKTELAIGCYEKSLAASNKQGDKYTQCLALEKLSILHRKTSPQKAIKEARQALETYIVLDNHSAVNAFYYTLNLADAFLYADSLVEAEETCNDAIGIADKLSDTQLTSYACQDMAVIMRKQGKYLKALDLSKEAINMAAERDNNLKFNLAAVYLDADSIKECLSILNTIEASSATEKYILFRMRHLASIKLGHGDEAIVFADSAYNQLEKMHAEEQMGKEEYYKKLTTTQVERRMLEEKASARSKLLMLLISFLVVVLSTVSYSYRQNRERAKLKIQKDQLERDVEKQLHEEEIKRKDLQLAMQKAEAQRAFEARMMEENMKQMKLKAEIQKAESARESDRKIHEEKMKHREIQLATMRKYVLSKINITKRIEELKGNKDNSVSLTDEDWEEIRIFIDNTEDNFVFRLKEKYPELTDDDLRFMMLIRLNLPSKAMAQIYGISDKSINQRLFVYKSKVKLGKEEKQSLREFIRTF